MRAKGQICKKDSRAIDNKRDRQLKKKKKEKLNKSKSKVVDLELLLRIHKHDRLTISFCLEPGAGTKQQTQIRLLLVLYNQ